MELKVGVQTTLTSSFGSSRTGRTVSVSIKDIDGNIVMSGFTLGSVIELGSGYYGVDITFSEDFVGYLEWNNSTDGIILFEPILTILNDAETLRKIETNRWLILANQLIIYDDDGTTPLLTWNLFNNGTPDGSAPNERVPV